MSEPPDSLTALSESTREQALARFRLLRPYLEESVPLSAIARAEHIPLRTLTRWLARYRTGGLAGLARAARADRGQHHLPHELHQLIEALALKRPPPSIATIHRQVQKIAEQHGWAAPSYGTVYAVVKELDPGLVMLAHEGAKAYKEAFNLLYRREAARPNEIWQADHTLLDIWVRDEQDRAVRPWLTVTLDDYSRAVAGYRVGTDAPSALRTALVLRQAIWRKPDPTWHVYGIPDTFYTDHGSDFTSHHLEQVAADIKMALVFSTIGQPRGRGRIERFFETVNQLFLAPLPGYTPEATAPPSRPSLTLAELSHRFHTFLLQDYHQRIHSETHMAPQERWASGAFIPRLVDRLEQLDLLLLTVSKPRRVQQDGIHFQGLRYLDLTLAAFVGEWVVIRYDPADLAEIRVYHHDRFLCRALCPEVASATIGVQDIVQARNARRLEMRAELHARQRVLDRLVAGTVPSVEPITPPAPNKTDQNPAAPTLKRYWNE